jgi:hypothetical protein
MLLEVKNFEQHDSSIDRLWCGANVMPAAPVVQYPDTTLAPLNG